MLGSDLINLNELYAKSKSQLHINDLVEDPTKNLRESLYNVLPEGGLIESYPTCGCGYAKYEENLEETCIKCGDKVEHRSEQNLESMFYIVKPVGVERFINPKIYIDLVTMCSINHNTFNPIHFLTISTYKPNKEHKAYLAMQAWGVERSWNYFVANIRELVPRVLQLIVDTTSRKFDHEMKAMVDLVNYHDDLIYCDVIPVINKLMLAIEQTGDIKRKSPTTEKYGLAITDLISLPTNPKTIIPDAKYIKRANDITGKMYKGLNEFFDDTYKREGKKGGLLRGDTLGLRSPFTWRGVIVQITRPHLGDELELPWTASTYLFEPQILRILCDDMAMSPQEALEFIEARRRVHCTILKDMFKRILYSFTDRGCPSYHVRYPTLYQLSGQVQYVNVVKDDPEDKTIGVPAASLAGMNADFDGKSTVLILDTNMVIITISM